MAHAAHTLLIPSLTLSPMLSTLQPSSLFTCAFPRTRTAPLIALSQRTQTRPSTACHGHRRPPLTLAHTINRERERNSSRPSCKTHLHIDSSPQLAPFATASRSRGELCREFSLLADPHRLDSKGALSRDGSQMWPRETGRNKGGRISRNSRRPIDRRRAAPTETGEN